MSNNIKVIVTKNECSTSSDKEVPVKSHKRKNLECPGCAKAYSSVVSLQDHIRKAHPHVRNELHNIVKAGQWRCTQFQCVMSSDGCMEVCKSRNELLRHLETAHDVGVDWVESVFKTLQEFDQYRVSLRSKGHFFIKATSRRKGRTAAEEPFVLFRCNREGQKVDRRGNKDNKNSIKIGTFCTAYLKIFFRKDSTIRCAGSLTHCNHAINYRVKEVEGGISGRLQVIEEDDVSQSAMVIGEDDMQLQNGVVMQCEEDTVSVQNEMHIVHEHIMNDEALHSFNAETEETQENIGETFEVAINQVSTTSDQIPEESAAFLVVTQEDSSAHRSLNALVEDTIWKLQKIQEERTGQRLIFYADALHQLVRSAHESISKTIMDHLQKNKSRKANLSNVQMSEGQIQ